MAQSSIPKIIHFCWFSPTPGASYPELVQNCINSWKQMLPNYTFMEWNAENSALNACDYVKEAFEAKKYAFVSDYVRLDALNRYGGIYLDTDVMVLRSFDPLLSNQAFAGLETSVSVGTCVIGSQPGNPLIQQMLEDYHKRHFLLSDGSYDTTPNPVMLTKSCQKKGLQLQNKEQILPDIHIYPMTYFCPFHPYRKESECFSEHTYSNHLFNGAWIDPETKQAMLYTQKFKQVLGEHLGGHLGAFIYRIQHDGIQKSIQTYHRKIQQNISKKRQRR